MAQVRTNKYLEKIANADYLTGAVLGLTGSLYAADRVKGESHKRAAMFPGMIAGTLGGMAGMGLAAHLGAHHPAVLALSGAAGSAMAGAGTGHLYNVAKKHFSEHKD